MHKTIISTGFDRLDAYLDGGIEDGELIFVGATSDIEAESFAFQLARQTGYLIIPVTINENINKNANIPYILKSAARVTGTPLIVPVKLAEREDQKTVPCICDYNTGPLGFAGIEDYVDIIIGLRTVDLGDDCHPNVELSILKNRRRGKIDLLFDNKKKNWTEWEI